MELELFCNRCGEKRIKDFYAITETIPLVPAPRVKKRFLVFCSPCGEEFVRWFKHEPASSMIDQTVTYKQIIALGKKGIL